MLKTADKETVSSAGEKVVYTFTITNTGNVHLKNIDLTDSKITTGFSYIRLNGEDFTGNIEELILQPGHILVATGDYWVSQEDIERAFIYNKARVTGKPPSGDDVWDEDDLTIEGSRNYGLSIEKEASNKEVKFVLGDKIKYKIIVTNIGNAILTKVLVKDDKVGLEDTIETLNPGASQEYEVEYEISQADINKGEVLNTASAQADQIEDPVEDNEEVFLD